MNKKKINIQKRKLIEDFYNFEKPIKKKRKLKPRGKPFNLYNNIAKGRTKGSVNKFTTLKKAFYDVFHALGGVDKMLEWAESDPENLMCFYKMIARMLPREIALTGANESDIKNIKVEIVSGNS